MAKEICGLLFLVVACVGLDGCGTAGALLVPVAGTGVQMAAAGQASNNAPKSNADLKKLELSAETTGDTFVQFAKTVIGRLGYQITGINGVGPTARVVTAKIQEIRPAFFVFSRTNIKIATVTMRLEANGRTITISTNTTDNTGEIDAEKIATAFKEELERLYAENKS